MERKLIDLKQQYKSIVDAAETALNAGNSAEFDAKIAESERVKNEISNVERLMAARGLFNDNDKHMLNLHDIQQGERQSNLYRSRVDNLRSEREYAKAWANAIRSGISPTRAVSMEELRPLTNVLTISGGEPTGVDGGFLVPIDFDRLLHEKEKEYFDLSTLFSNETVSLMSGWRAIAKTGSDALPKIDEAQPIGKTKQPSFEKVSYNLSKYGDRLAISRELLNAEPGVLMAYIARWFALRHVTTKNKLLFDLLDKLEATDIAAGEELAGIKTALNKGLNTAHSRGAVILTSQTGYDTLDNLTDDKNRPLLVPNPADPDTYRLKGKPIRFMDDDLFPDSEGKAPLYIGKFSAYGTLFQRGGIEIASTDIGGDAWANASPEIRAMTFLDAQIMDKSAVVKRTFAASEAA